MWHPHRRSRDIRSICAWQPAVVAQARQRQACKLLLCLLTWAVCGPSLSSYHRTDTLAINTPKSLRRRSGYVSDPESTDKHTPNRYQKGPTAARTSQYLSLGNLQCITTAYLAMLLLCTTAGRCRLGSKHKSATNCKPPINVYTVHWYCV